MPLRVSFATFILLFVASLAPAAPSTQPAGKMELGSNFWNIGWHDAGDCFRDWKNVRGDDPWNPEFLKEIRIYRSLRFMD